MGLDASSHPSSSVVAATGSCNIKERQERFPNPSHTLIAKFLRHVVRVLGGFEDLDVEFKHGVPMDERIIVKYIVDDESRSVCYDGGRCSRVLTIEDQKWFSDIDEWQVMSLGEHKVLQFTKSELVTDAQCALTARQRSTASVI